LPNTRTHPALAVSARRRLDPQQPQLRDRLARVDVQDRADRFAVQLGDPAHLTGRVVVLGAVGGDPRDEGLVRLCARVPPGKSVMVSRLRRGRSPPQTDSMEIAIRPKLDRADVEELARKHLPGPVEVVGHEEFKDGFFNAAHALELADGRHVVVKVAPGKEHELLRYEVDLMATEIECFERGLAAGVPMPALHYGDPEGGVMIIDRLKGVSFPKAKDDMSKADLLAVRREIGALSARFATVSGERFGYPRKSGRTVADTWSASFQAMIADVLADIAENDSPLPCPVEDIAALVAAERELLDEVTRPALVHFDLWDGNVFVERAESGWRVEAFIDGERAFYGDPVAEIVSLEFCPADEIAAAVDGFLGREPTAGEERRLALYRMYLMLILIAECAVRGFDEEQTAHQMQWSTETLVKSLASLKA
jgi:aminoglycoside phosphotransferase (APT) family kinase protein